MKCPTCGSLEFYAKDPDDEYEEYRFTLQGDAVVPDPTSTDALEIIQQSEAFCERCAWHGRLDQLKP
ncbi:MAG: hypothetical protein PVJ53_05435 [Desulfobacterales bacterium]